MPRAATRTSPSWPTASPCGSSAESSSVTVSTTSWSPIRTVTSLPMSSCCKVVNNVR
ncbi:Uncharacterised protein [Mycobacterium tuberculosis]|uniref:Uncharacterized protein n=1 Tax=Mycobacterium tuberculosis TaxID=1773 RepID=A0A916LB38_MYCTX|nr:Uncharacterised protein [Mycobacterium tuberculosis]COY06272.1 Uncharacterised protein [Mycobacterium tuberculosis]